MEEGNSTSSMNEQLVSVVDTPMKEKNDDLSPTAIVLQHVTCDVLRANNAVANDAFTAKNSACTSAVNEAQSANRTALEDTQGENFEFTRALFGAIRSVGRRSKF